MLKKIDRKGDFFKESNRRNEMIAIIFIAVSIFMFVSLASFNYNDVPFFSSEINKPVKNFAGIVGAYLGGALLFLMGWSAYSLPILILFWAAARFAGSKTENFYFKAFGAVFLILAISSAFGLAGGREPSMQFGMGGLIGVMFSGFLTKYLGIIGAIVCITVLLLLSILIATDFLIFPFVKFIMRALQGWFRRARPKVVSSAKSALKLKFAPRIEAKKPLPRPSSLVPRPSSLPLRPSELQSSSPPAAVKPEKISEPKPVRAPEPPTPAKPTEEKTEKVIPEMKKEDEAPPYILPSLDLLKSPPPPEEREIREDLADNSRILEETLADFDIEAKVIEVNRGPVITRYELEPASGVKIHRITSLSDNIALAMKAESIRIVAPVPGKGTIGVEVPNSKSTLVYLKEILSTDEYIEEESKLKLCLGKTIAGEPLVTDLAIMPHLLIAGATGSGKTVCVNSIIASILFNATPDEVKFIMIDPKKVELAPFNNLPHLLCPVVTDYKKVPVALEWLVNEMEKRYSLLAETAVRNIDAYNKKAEEEGWQPLYYIIIIIDELADLMLVSQQEIESAITRLAQLSRAVGIHMILATQRPSVDVITGVIKANFPSRISFKVASKVDSKVVLDMNGAEKLLGRGDMLFIEPGEDKPIRAQGSLIFDEEIENLASYIKGQMEPRYVEEIVRPAHKRGQGPGKFRRDEIYEEAKRIILETKQASVSMLQRKLGVGYTKAARLIDMMEEDGIVGPYQGSKPRDILIENLEETSEKAE